MAGEKINVLLIESREILRRGVFSLLQEQRDIKVVAETSTATNGIAIYATTLVRVEDPEQISVVITGLELPDRNGIDVIKELKAINAASRVILLALWPNNTIVGEALEAGADGFLLYDQATSEELVMAVRAVARGGGALSPALARVFLRQANERLEDQRQRAALTGREIQVLRLLASGETSKEIGASLNLSPRTIDNYRIRILDKLGAESTVEAIVIASRRGLLEI